MTAQNYFYPIPIGGFRWNAYHQKVKIAIGRTPNGGSIVNNQLCLRFDPPLDSNEEILVTAIFADPNTAARVPMDQGSSFIIKDIWDSTFISDLAMELNCDVWIWFYRSEATTPENLTDRMAITFSKSLSVQERKTAENAFESLVEGWGAVVEL